MNEQLYLIAQITNILCKDFVDPQTTYGANVGRCRYCGVFGKVQYPNIVFEHAGDCVVSLNKSLQALMQSPEGDSGISHGSLQFNNALGRLSALHSNEETTFGELHRFLLQFAEHIVNNVSCEDLDRLEMQEIIERIPDMELVD